MFYDFVNSFILRLLKEGFECRGWHQKYRIYSPHHLVKPLNYGIIDDDIK